MKKSAIILAVLAFSALTAVRGAEVPYLTGRVNDNAQILTQETARMLSDTLAAHEQRTGNQVVVLTIPTLSGEDIEGYANRVFNEWKLGQKEKNNGILVVVAPNDRRMRIEVGYGLEAMMTDGMASRIISEVMTPRFRDNDYNGGVTDGVLAVVKVLDGGELPEAIPADAGSKSKRGFFSSMEGPDLSVTERLLMGAFIFGIIGLFTFMGIVGGGFGWFLYFFLIPFWALFPIIVVGPYGALACLITYLVAYPILKLALRKTAWVKKFQSRGGSFGGSSSGSSWVSSGGSSGSSGFSSSSSFSGGGGSSGGGGASGSW